MDDVKRGEVLQGQARITTAAAFAVVFAIMPSLPLLNGLIRQTKASHYGKKPYECRTVSNLKDINRIHKESRRCSIATSV
jgi:hypothetical protein